MSTVITLVVLLLLVLVIVWLHFFRQQQVGGFDQNVRDDTNVNLYHEHKAEIEADFAQGKIDQENYDYLRQELDKSLLQDVQENQQHKEVFEQKSLSIIWPVGISLFVLVFSFALYDKIGAFEQLSMPQQIAQQDQMAEAERARQQETLTRIAQLREQLAQQPNDADTWYSLGQALVGVGDFNGAISAFAKVEEIDGPHADIYGAMAQATYYRENQEITPEVQTLIDKALAIDPLDPSTNILLGMHSFMHQDYAKAIQYWQPVIDSGRSNVNAQALQEAVNEAKNRLALTGQAQEIESEQAVTGSQLSLNVSIGDSAMAELIQQEDKNVFIYAIASDGPKMPIAAVKVLASDLPATIVLNDSQAMMPQMKLSMFERVHVFAVISQDGTPGVKPGDYQAVVRDIIVADSKPLDVVIDEKVTDSVE
ncbi:c-type cytochrome biogenesis protein CcmI [Thalassotalea sp. LPB0316]|uniref:c-type cytochrome biogenesis protein CcmI n=1 Tax=Thalassotalea sp. LPB0316 TaxID=2769490 RepID=UPI001867B0C4|nr:c-type cytochrome biogenesis protein CcmI [Thalassotalea sp. LPB0316]QOL25865.1 c-type cytochrome biogenesis protein CcmI [Thalassotalea sp. LPB0316]